METRLSPIDSSAAGNYEPENDFPAILIIGKESDFSEFIMSLNRLNDCNVDEVNDGAEAIDKLKEKDYSLVFICGNGEGYNEDMVRQMKRTRPSISLFNLSRLELCDMRHESKEILSQEISDGVVKYSGLGGLVGVSSVMQKVYEKIRKASQEDCAVLLQGESGTGKELAARAVHQYSKRKKFPFIPVNCSAIPDNLMESELFGYVRGAFSGAVANTQGILRTASGGTVFFDEIGELNIGLQAKLLRFVEDKKVKPLGSNNSYVIDVRIIVATNADLREEINKGGFRRDLFYRINVLPIYMPPLRSKKEDIPPLVDHFLEKYGRNTIRMIRGVSLEVMSAFFRYSWPGNVREMENLLQQAIIMNTGPILTMKNFPDRFSGEDWGALRSDDQGVPTLKEVERDLIQKALRVTEGNVASAARLLGVDRKTIYRKVKRLSIHI
jgi:transcriptional regulator with PAS, ATPase and Fis domain